ncbi:MAG: metallophosphoesterase [Synechococcaceae cyanobacterium]|nr:metallophosphoesterase [Synechococcaceae cyanobacterium]
MTSPTRPPRHWVIGDVHGCAEALVALLERLPAGDRLVFCGDVINRGPAIAAAMDLAWGLVRSGRAVWLQGNHERELVDGLRGPAGGRAHHRLAGCATFRQLGEAGCRAWIDRLESLPLAYWAEGWVATHAGFDPLSWQPHLAIRLPFWQAYDGRFGDVVVGHTPGPRVRRLDRIVMVDTGACYGGPLSAYCPETGEVRQVAGARPGPLAGLGAGRSLTPC